LDDPATYANPGSLQPVRIFECFTQQVILRQTALRIGMDYAGPPVGCYKVDITGL